MTFDGAGTTTQAVLVKLQCGASPTPDAFRFRYTATYRREGKRLVFHRHPRRGRRARKPSRPTISPSPKGSGTS